MRYATLLTLGVLVHAIYWARMGGGDRSLDLPTLRGIEPNTVLPEVCSYHLTIFQKGRFFYLLVF